MRATRVASQRRRGPAPRHADHTVSRGGWRGLTGWNPHGICPRRRCSDRRSTGTSHRRERRHLAGRHDDRQVRHIKAQDGGGVRVDFDVVCRRVLDALVDADSRDGSVGEGGADGERERVHEAAPGRKHDAVDAQPPHGLSRDDAQALEVEGGAVACPRE